MRSVNRLTDRTVKTLSRPGRHGDGAGLYLEVKDSGSRSWLFMAKSGGRQKWLGLGRYPDTPLGLAREKAAAARRMLAEGGDPFAEAKKVREPTFGECVDLFLDDQRKAAWKSAPHKRAWEMTLSDVYCRHIRPMQVSQIGTSDILLTLKPIWMAKPTTAMRLRGRIERVLSFAKMHGWRDENRANPAQWRGCLDQLLVAPRKLRQVRHHEAMSYDLIPDFVTRLRTVSRLSACALEFLILVAGRASEVTGARWDELDLVGGIWRIPGSRMKNGLPHEVVLSSRALAILRELTEIRCNEFVFFAAWPEAAADHERPGNAHAQDESQAVYDPRLSIRFSRLGGQRNPSCAGSRRGGSQSPDRKSCRAELPAWRGNRKAASADAGLVRFHRRQGSEGDPAAGVLNPQGGSPCLESQAAV